MSFYRCGGAKKLTNLVPLYKIVPSNSNRTISIYNLKTDASIVGTGSDASGGSINFEILQCRFGYDGVGYNWYFALTNKNMIAYRYVLGQAVSGLPEYGAYWGFLNILPLRGYNCYTHWITDAGFSATDTTVLTDN